MKVIGEPIPQQKKRARKGGKKNRKHGRNKKKPSHMRYTAERRWEKNKKRKAQRRANKFGKPVRIKLNDAFVLIEPARH